MAMRILVHPQAGRLQVLPTVGMYLLHTGRILLVPPAFITMYLLHTGRIRLALQVPTTMGIHSLRSAHILLAHRVHLCLGHLPRCPPTQNALLWLFCPRFDHSWCLA